MDALGSDRFHFESHLSAAHVRPEHYADFQRLLKSLRYGSQFQLLIAEFNDVPYRSELIDRIGRVVTEAKLRSVRFDLAARNYATVLEIEAELVGLATDHEIIHWVGGESWFREPKRWEALNIRREAIASCVKARLVMWLTTEQIGQMAVQAPDAWAWRGGVFSFLVVRESKPLLLTENRPIGDVDTRSLLQRSKRISELRAVLQSTELTDNDFRLALLDELAGLLRSLGELDVALRIRMEEILPLCELLGDVHSKAVTQGNIAEILQECGQKAEALTVLNDAEAAYLKLNDNQGLAQVKALRTQINKN